jgi:hypothetical protein
MLMSLHLLPCDDLLSPIKKEERSKPIKKRTHFKNIWCLIVKMLCKNYSSLVIPTVFSVFILTSGMAWYN